MPVCSQCGAVMDRQPLVRPLPLLILITVGSVLVASSIPALFDPRSPQKQKSRPTDRSLVFVEHLQSTA